MILFTPELNPPASILATVEFMAEPRFLFAEHRHPLPETVALILERVLAGL